MGCCVSKCRGEKHSLQHQDLFNLNRVCVQDKLVIPTPTIPYQYSSNKISPSPPSPTSSTSSISSFTCTTSNTLSSTSSFSTASSSKDRSFSNDFLWSCYKDNPHIIRINSLKQPPTIPTKLKSQYRNIHTNPSSSPLAPMTGNLFPPQKVGVGVSVGSVSVPQKRLRSSSPTNLTRQKSFRLEHAEKPVRNSGSNIPIASRVVESPSPSRRFTNSSGDHKRASVSKRIYSRGVASSSVIARNESFKAVTSPNNSSRRLHNGLRHRESCTYGLGSKIDETLVNDVLSSNHDMMEDIDNPLISLDCFIFL